MELNTKNVAIITAAILLGFTVIVSWGMMAGKWAGERGTTRVVACIEKGGPDLILCLKEAE